MNLTGEQKIAVLANGNVLLTACPGSGKTKTIVAKLLKEMDSIRGTPKSVACITYTNTAVQEIEHRVSVHLNAGDELLYTVGTIHSFCLNNILRPFSWKRVGFNGIPLVLTPDKPIFEEIVRYAYAKVNFHNVNARNLEPFEGLNLDSHGNLIGAVLDNEEAVKAAPHFWKRCEELGYIDFGNIIYQSYCLLRDNPAICDSLGARFPWILVDEFQDTTELQTEILKLIHLRGRSKFFAVGDPAQSIYGFTGARPELLQPFAASIAADSSLSLTGNFRSNPQIVSHAEKLFSRTPPMIALGANKTCAIEPEYVHVDDYFVAITDHFLPKLHCLGIEYGDATILAPSWGMLFPLSRQLREYGIPVVGPGARPYRRSRLFATLAELLCGAIADPQSNSMPAIQKALFNSILELTTEPHFGVFSYSGRRTIVRLLNVARDLASKNDGAVKWLDNMSQKTGRILTDDGLITAEHGELFFDSVQEMKADMERQNVDTANLRIEDLGLFASSSRALRLSTFHYAKGREYTAVALIGLLEGTIPHVRSRTSAAVQADKRLFYVGVTRAKRYLLYISRQDRRNLPSRFLGADGVAVLEET